jgi:hypothetical protein
MKKPQTPYKTAGGSAATAGLHRRRHPDTEAVAKATAATGRLPVAAKTAAFLS